MCCIFALAWLSFPLAADDRSVLHGSVLVAGGDLAVPEQRSKVLPQPVLDDRSHHELQDQQDSSRSYQLDSEAGRIRFGDGDHGRRLPSTGEGEQRSYRYGTGQTDKTTTPSPSGPVPIPYPNVSSHAFPSQEHVPEVDDEVLAAFENGNYQSSGKYVVVSVRHQLFQLQDGRYRSKSGKSFTIRNGHFIVDD